MTVPAGVDMPLPAGVDMFGAILIGADCREERVEAAYADWELPPENAEEIAFFTELAALLIAPPILESIDILVIKR